MNTFTAYAVDVFFIYTALGGVPLALRKSSSTGPDWTDVLLLMTELEVLHAVDVSLQMSPDGARGATAVTVVALAVRRGAPTGEAPQSVSRRHHVPAGGVGTMAPACYKLLVELDWDCSSMWRQSPLPIA